MLDKTVKKNAGTSNQKLILFNLGNAISGAPINKGTNQLPNPPSIKGITVKKIITKACAVITTLYTWVFSKKSTWPGVINSKRINNDKTLPQRPQNAPKNRYKVPMSL